MLAVGKESVLPFRATPFLLPFHHHDRVSSYGFVSSSSRTKPGYRLIAVVATTKLGPSCWPMESRSRTGNFGEDTDGIIRDWSRIRTLMAFLPTSEHLVDPMPDNLFGKRTALLLPGYLQVGIAKAILFVIDRVSVIRERVYALPGVKEEPHEDESEGITGRAYTMRLFCTFHGGLRADEACRLTPTNYCSPRLSSDKPSDERRRFMGEVLAFKGVLGELKDQLCDQMVDSYSWRVNNSRSRWY
ncbi:hypothetical protein BDZ89DRAFT_1050162 [Hymenopellis radicata]|nr:hypothetical protein BDZ89DRAFT_1050162 [Hymenopellis radicata]